MDFFQYWFLLGGLFAFNAYDLPAMRALDLHYCFVIPDKIENPLTADRTFDDLLHKHLLSGIFNTYPYFFFREGFVCDNALAATDFVFFPVLPSLSREEALLATNFEVCFLFALAMILTTFHFLLQQSLSAF